MSAVESIVGDILSKRRELSQQQVLTLIEEKKQEGRGLLSDEGAARLVAEELLIQTRGTDIGRMHVKDLVPGLNDVTISGRILMTWPPQSFQRKDGTPGRVMRMVLADKSDRVRCAVWDRHVDVLAKTGELQGRVLRIGHAYTRQGLAGDTEIHAGDRSSIQVDPDDASISDLPQFGDLFTPLAKLAVGTTQVNAIGIVRNEPRRYNFAKDDRTGVVLRAVVADESGSIPFVVWNERAEELGELKEGDILQALNARVRTDRNGSPELHVEARSQVKVFDSPPPYLKRPVAKPGKISDLTTQGTVNLAVSVLAVEPPQAVKRQSGEDVKVSRLLVSDESGILSLSLWDDKSDFANQLQTGDVIELTGATVRQTQGGSMLSLGKSGSLQKAVAKQIPLKSVTKLNALQESKWLISVEGVVADTPMTRQVVTERGESVDLTSFTLRDDTGSSRVTFWREQAAAAMALRVGARVKIQGVRVRTGFNGGFELSSIPLSRIEATQNDSKKEPAWEDIRHVIALEAGLTTWIKGVVLDVLDDPIISLICESCGAELALLDGDLTCKSCSKPRMGRLAFSTRVRFDDGTGVVEVGLSDVDPSPLHAFDNEEIKKQMVKSHTTRFMLSRDQTSGLVGREVALNGTAERSSGSDKLWFKANKISLASTS